MKIKQTRKIKNVPNKIDIPDLTCSLINPVDYITPVTVWFVDTCYWVQSTAAATKEWIVKVKVNIQKIFLVEQEKKMILFWSTQ